MTEKPADREDGEQLREEISKEELRGGMLMRHALTKIHENRPKLEELIGKARLKVEGVEGKKGERMQEILDEAEETLRYADKAFRGLSEIEKDKMSTINMHVMAIGSIIAAHLTALTFMVGVPMLGVLPVSVMAVVFGFTAIHKKFIDFDRTFASHQQVKMSIDSLEGITGKSKKE